MSVAHVAVAYYDSQAKGLVDCVFDPTGTAQCDTPDASPSPGDSEPTDSLEPGDTPGPTFDVGTPPPGATDAPTETVKPWTGGRLNILLIGADQRPKQSVFNTDTLIVASLDPKTNQVAMFSLPRDTIQVPLPSGPAQGLFGIAFPCKINSLWAAAQHRPDVFPGNDKQRGFQALKDTLGNLYGLDIPYYAEVNFDGFRKVVDAVGGVTINVQIPVLDDDYPGDDGRTHRIYIPAGLQHMTGAQALEYARSRHVSSDYDRAARQQRVLFSLKDQVDVSTLIPKLPGPHQRVQVDDPHRHPGRASCPRCSSWPAEWTRRASARTSSRRRSTARRSTARSAATATSRTSTRSARPSSDALSGKASDEAKKEAIADRGRHVWVLNGSGQTGQAATSRRSSSTRASAPRRRARGRPRPHRRRRSSSTTTRRRPIRPRSPTSRTCST